MIKSRRRSYFYWNVNTKGFPACEDNAVKHNGQVFMLVLIHWKKFSKKKMELVACLGFSKFCSFMSFQKRWLLTWFFLVSSVILYLHLKGLQRSHMWLGQLPWSSQWPNLLWCGSFHSWIWRSWFACGRKASGVTLDPFVSTSKRRLDLNEKLCSKNKLFYLKALSPNVTFEGFCEER